MDFFMDIAWNFRPRWRARSDGAARSLGIGSVSRFVLYIFCRSPRRVLAIWSHVARKLLPSSWAVTICTCWRTVCSTANILDAFRTTNSCQSVGIRNDSFASRQNPIHLNHQNLCVPLSCCMQLVTSYLVSLSRRVCNRSVFGISYINKTLQVVNLRSYIQHRYV